MVVFGGRFAAEGQLRRLSTGAKKQTDFVYGFVDPEAWSLYGVAIPQMLFECDQNDQGNVNSQDCMDNLALFCHILSFHTLTLLLHCSGLGF